MVTVKVPATSANMGPGFDCIGVALALYNTISAEETDCGLQIDIVDESSDYLPHDSRNLVYKAMMAVFDEAWYKPEGIHIIQKNDIPVTRGLGSSSASIVGGIMTANEICNAKMSREEIITFAAKLEGHPDNVTPAVTGGMAVAVIGDNNTYYQKIPIDSNKIKFAVFIPDFILRTKKARSVIPETIPHADAVFNTARAALLTASIITENYDNLKVAFGDKLHQQYRKRFIKGVDKIFKNAGLNGALGSYISGAGPAVISLIKAEDEERFCGEINTFLAQNTAGWNLMILEPDNQGAKLI